MKNKLIIILFLMTILITLTGCGNVKTLDCSVTSSNYLGEVTSNLKVKVRNNEVKDMTLTLDMELSKDQLANRQAIINQLSQKTNKIYVTEKGLKAMFSMGNSYFDTFGITKDASYSELKQVLELQGYTCKE